MTNHRKKNKGRASEREESELPVTPDPETTSEGLQQGTEHVSPAHPADIDQSEHTIWDDDGPKPAEQAAPAGPFGFGQGYDRRPAEDWDDDQHDSDPRAEHMDLRRSSSNPFIESLKPVSGPLLITDKRQEKYKISEVHFTACEPLTSSGGLTNAEFARKRLEDAIRLGEQYLARKPVPYPTRRFTRSEARSEIFKDIIEAVNELLTQVIRYSNGNKADAYSVQRSLLVRVKRKLSIWFETGKSDLAELGLETLPHPAWGLSGRGDEFWNANDFEILGACFRKAVEEYVTTIVDAMSQCAEIREEERREADEIAAGARDMQARLEGYFISKGISRKNEKRTVDFDDKSTLPPTKVKMEPMSASTHARTMRGASLSPSVFSQPNRMSSSRKMHELFGDIHHQDPERSASRPPVSPRNPFRTNSENQRQHTDESSRRQRQQPPHMTPRTRENPRDEPSDDSSSSDDEGSDHRRRNNSRIPNARRKEPRDSRSQTANASAGFVRSNEVHFENKLKLDIIPTWDGKTDELVRWFAKVNRLAERSQTAFVQLGNLIPSRLSGSAETWYFSLPLAKQLQCEESWGNMREAIAAYYMNRTFMEAQKIKANNVKYREGSTNTRETPSEYFIRKLELLQLVYDYTDSELITEIMKGAPTSWVSIVTPHLFEDITEFQTVVRFHEETLMKIDTPRPNPYRFDNNPFNRDSNRNRPDNFRNARVNLVGGSDKLPLPQYPKDDTNVSRRQTPESKGFRPCRHCGSGKHWDNECKYSRKSQRSARANHATILDEDLEAQQEYDDGYYDLLSEDEIQKDF